MEEWLTKLASLEDFSAENIETEFKAFLTEKELGIGAVLPNFRVLLTGKGMGPSMFSIANLLGKEECVARMEAGIKAITAIKAEA